MTFELSFEGWVLIRSVRKKREGNSGRGNSKSKDAEVEMGWLGEEHREEEEVRDEEMSRWEAKGTGISPGSQ